MASSGEIASPTREALARLKASGRKLILVTGRHLDDLQRVCPRLDLFDIVVAENGVLLYRPATHEARALAAPPPEAFVQTLRSRGVEPLAVGRVIVATSRRHERVVREAIQAKGFALQIIFNKDAVMVLPSGTDKATGLDAALAELGLPPESTVGVGDAENDEAFLDRCGCAVAVSNALPSVKQRADLVTAGAGGAGVAELCVRLVASDLSELASMVAARRAGRAGVDTP